MGQPVQWGGVSQLDWVPTLKTILNADDKVDVWPDRITGPPWLTFDLSFTGIIEDRGASPWNHWMPLDANHTGWNYITIYRKIFPTSRRGYFQLLRGRFDFFEPSGNYDFSPARQAEQFVALSASVVDSIRSSPVLDANGFTQASQTLDRIVTWLRDTGQPRVTAMMNDADPDDFSGTAAEVFLWAMEDLRFGMGDLQSIIRDPSSWITALSDAATAIDTFKTAMETAWTTFKNYRYHNPNWLVGEVVRSFERQMDAHDAQVGFTWSANRTTLDEWWFDFSGIEGLGRYNLVQQDAWARLSDDMKATWTANHTTLENSVHTATQALISSLSTVWAALGRGVRTLQTLPPPAGITPDGGPDGSGNGPDLTGGNGPDLTGGNGPDLTGGNGPDLTGGNGPDLTGGNGPNLTGGNGPDLTGGGSEFTGGLPGFAGGTGPGLGAGGSVIGGLPGPGGSSSGFTGPDLAGRVGGTAGAGLPPLTGGMIGGGPGGASGSSGGSVRIPGGVGGGVGVGGGMGGGVGRGVGGSGGVGPDLPGRFVGGSGPRSAGGGVIGPMGAAPPGYEGPAGSLEDIMRGAGVDVPAVGGASGGGAAGLATGGGGAGVLGGTSGAGLSAGSLTGAAAGPGAAGTAAGAGTGASTGGYPFMPPMMGGMGGNRGENERERERTTWLAEEAEVWGTDPDCSPAVIGAEDETGATPVTAPTAWPHDPGHRRPHTQGPSRATH